MQRVIFDSSFLMAVAEHPTDWLEDIRASRGGFQPVVLDCVRSELERLASGSGRRSKLAALAIQISRDFVTLPCKGRRVDEEIASKAQEENAAVATVDGELAASLRALRVPVVGLRSGRVATS